MIKEMYISFNKAFNLIFHHSFRFMGLIILAFSLSSPNSFVNAQDELPGGAIYIVREGDSLWDVAARFGVSVDALKSVNGISDPNQLAVGAGLVIPGLDGYEGILDTHTISYGETLRSLSRRYQVSGETLARLNHLTTPAALFPGANLVIPAQNVNPSSGQRLQLAPGQTILELAVLQNTNPWEFVVKNDLPGTWGAIPGDVLLSDDHEKDGPGALPGVIDHLSLSPLPLTQGKTMLVEVSGKPEIMLNGSLGGLKLNFYPHRDGYVALQGIHALTEPGLYSLNLNGKFPPVSPQHGETFTFTQPVFIRSGDYPYDPVLNVSPEMIDPAVTLPEDQFWESLVVTASPEKLWQGSFQSPVPNEFENCWTSLFGTRRSYNGSPYNYFHTGLDLCGGVGTEIFAPATGKVVFAGPLTVRGNATVIDHGWGIYTAYDHQSEVFVNPGEYVEPGQLIGLGGATGRVTGPHLHLEVWVGGVQVDPIDWLQKSFP
jgi:murein DD-endopeptidase MepM/ murein hydrolase activator NlpD